MYNVKDNAEAKLQVWLSSLATTLVVELGNGMLFPDAPFIAVLNKRDSDWKITKSEKVDLSNFKIIQWKKVYFLLKMQHLKISIT